MNERTACRLHLKVTPLQQNEQKHLFSANGSNILLSGKAEVTLFLKGVTFKCNRRAVRSFINDLVAPVSIKTCSEIPPKRKVM